MGKILEVDCPGCTATLWIDADSGDVIQHKHKDKAKASLEEMLQKEKRKKENVDNRFLQAKNLEEEKKRKAEALFKSNFTKDNK